MNYELMELRLRSSLPSPIPKYLCIYSCRSESDPDLLWTWALGGLRARAAGNRGKSLNDNEPFILSLGMAIHFPCCHSNEPCWSRPRQEVETDRDMDLIHFLWDFISRWSRVHERPTFFLSWKNVLKSINSNKSFPYTFLLSLGVVYNTLYVYT